MLYRTQNPFTFRFNTFPPPPPVAYLSTPVQRMERLEGSFRRSEMEEFLVNNDAANEDFFVENLLVDGQDVFFEAETGDENVAEEAADKTPTPTPTPLSVLPEPKTEQSGISTADVDDFGSVPADDEADLEWLSHFVEDSFSGYSMTCHTEKMPENTVASHNEPVQSQPTITTTTPLQTKVRTKRARTGGRVWSLTGSSSSTTESDTSLVCSGQTADSLAPPAKKKKKKRVATTALLGSGVVVRRCTHCGVTKTPQWRLGPLGAKTLCNACGVRFKSGRLLPEYRPACSPTFSSEMHSNNHRKVLEMRMKKEGIN